MSPRAKLPPKRKTKANEAERVANVEADIKAIEVQIAVSPEAIDETPAPDVISKLDATLAGFTFTPPVAIADLQQARTMLRAAIGDDPFDLELRIEGEHSANPRVLVELFAHGSLRPCCERVLPIKLDGSVG